MTTTADSPQTKKFGGLRFDANPDRETRGKMDPVERALHIGQARLRESANQIGVGSDPEATLSTTPLK